LPSCEPQVIYTKYAERKVNETSDKSRVDVCSKVNNECRITNSDGNSCDLCAIYRYRRNGICRRQRINFNDNCNPVIASIVGVARVDDVKDFPREFPPFCLPDLFREMSQEVWKCVPPGVENELMIFFVPSAVLTSCA